MSLGYIRILVLLAWAFVVGIFVNMQEAGIPLWRTNIIAFPLMGMVCVFVWWHGSKLESARKSGRSIPAAAISKEAGDHEQHV